jgi:hypothetical protein
MGGKREKPEDIILKLRQVEVLQGQGKPLADAVRQIGVTVQTIFVSANGCLSTKHPVRHFCLNLATSAKFNIRSEFTH